VLNKINVNEINARKRRVYEASTEIRSLKIRINVA
jgi:hypothetical protein